MMMFLYTEPFRRWLATQPVIETVAITLAGLGLGGWVLL